MGEAGCVQEIPFDLYERYVLVEHAGRLFRPRAGPYRILDVSRGTPAGLLIPDASVAAVNRRRGAELPFGDGAFDLVCAVDTPAHMPAGERPAFLAELLRVTRDGLYVAFPCDSADNRWADAVLFDYTNAVLGEPLAALLDHREFGLPERESVARPLSGGEYAAVVFEHGSNDIRLLMLMAYYRLRARDPDLAAEWNGRFQAAYAARSGDGPVYRAGYLVSKQRSAAELEAARAAFCAGLPAMDHAAFFRSLPGRRNRYVRRFERQMAPAAPRPRLVEPRAPEGEITLGCDYPAAEFVLPVREVVEIRGRARASSGITRVLVQIDDDPPLAAAYAEESGYRFFWDTAGLPEGRCTVRVTAIARSGESRTVVCRVAVDRTTPPDYGLWIARNEREPAAQPAHTAFRSVVDADVELAPCALAELARAIDAYPDTDLFYGDGDRMDAQGRRYDPFFKPGWSPDLLRSCNYMGGFVALRAELADRLAGYEGYELLLRASEQTQKIRRIPKVLYHRRAGGGRDSAAERRALASYLERQAPGASVEEAGAGRYRVRYPIAGEPRVSILIPTGGHETVYRAVERVREATDYENYEIVVIDNSRGERIAEFAGRLARDGAPVRHFDWRGKPFNFARMNNAAARGAAARYLLFLNDDTEVISREWLTAMLEHAQRPEAGAVGAQLLYPNGRIQHAGVVMGIYGNCSHAFRGLPGGRPHYFDFPNLIRNCSAVTGACLLVAREKFFAVGGFDEAHLKIAFQDVDLCLTLLELGYRNVYTPYARLYHHESASKSEKDKIPDAAEDLFMKRKWARYIADDPYYNPNLTRAREDFSLAVP